MSGSGDIISFDLRRGKWESIDLAAMLPLSRLHPLDHSGGRDILDDMTLSRTAPDLVPPMRITLDRFTTLETLDLATHEIREVTYDPYDRMTDTWAKKTLSIIDPIYIPYGSLDVRRYEKKTSSRTYPDLFTRSLPYGLMVRRTVKRTGHLVRKQRKPIMIGMLAFFLMSVPLMYFVKMSIERWYRELANLTHATWSIAIQDHILSARWEFERARVVFFPFSWIPNEKIRLADTVLEWWLALTRWLDSIVRTLPTDTGSTINIPKTQSITPSYRWTAEDIFVLGSVGIESPTTWIRDNHQVLQEAQSFFEQAGRIYTEGAWHNEYSQILQSVWGTLQTFASWLDWYNENQDNVLSILGDDDPKRYIVFNQNRDEIRANGGFPGSVITFTLYKWNILDLRKDDVYYYDWNLYPYKEIPPPGIALLTDNYGLRDVNYYPDFRTTLEKANSFIERSWDSTLTSGIAIHQWLIENILEKIWPVTLSWVTTSFTHENFSALMSTLVETQYGRENHAKDILFQFISAFTEKINSTKSYMAVIDTLSEEWKNGEILFASRDQWTDAFIAKYRKKLPWECHQRIEGESELVDSGIPCSPNWIYPVFTSVSGNKSDRYINRTYRATTTKILGCKYENLLTITNTHTFWKNNLTTIQSYLDSLWIIETEERQKFLFIQWNAKNKAFVRLYTPLGSELSLTWSDIKSEDSEHATVFSFLLETPPGSSTSKTIRYTTNVPNCQNYTGNIDWYVQPWLRRVDIK